jgi:hypothetical protein
MFIYLTNLYNMFMFMNYFFNFYLVYRFYLWFNPFFVFTYDFIFRKEELKLLEDKKY